MPYTKPNYVYKSIYQKPHYEYQSIYVKPNYDQMNTPYSSPMEKSNALEKPKSNK